MSRSQSQYTTIRSEGGLLPTSLLERVARPDPTLSGLDTDSYYLARGERFGEVINRSWLRLVGAWAGLRESLAGTREGDPATGVTRDRWLFILFQELGYGRLQAARAIEVDGIAYPISHEWGPVPIHLVGAGVRLDTRTAGVAGAARSSPHSLVQDLLNRDADRLWGIVSNGLQLRLLRDNVALTRQSFVEFDLEAMMDGEVYADFTVLWLLAHQSRFEADNPEACWLERWSHEARTQGSRALEHLSEGVQAAVELLGSGFLAHSDNGVLRTQLEDGSVRPIDFYRQLLRVVYRILFVLVAEERDLLLLQNARREIRDTYRRYYSVTRIRELAERRRGTRHTDLWQQVQVVTRLLGSADGCPLLALPALGSFLFSDEATAALNVCRLGNDDFLAALRSLSGRNDERAGYRWRFDYRNLGAEELGSVYETLLDLHAEVNVPAGRFTLSTGGAERRTTGSHYTPTPILKKVLDFALEPAVQRALQERDSEQALLGLRVLDPACGSGHFLIAAAHRIAQAVASVRTGEVSPSPEATRAALRDVVARCLYGVDLNPMAVELCRVALWLETLDPGKPLGFLDHHIRVGNSLLGVPLGSTVARDRAAVEHRRRQLEDRIGTVEDAARGLRAGDPEASELHRELKSIKAELAKTAYNSWADAIPEEAFKATSEDDRAVARKVAATHRSERKTKQLALSNVLVELPDELITIFERLGEGAEDSIAEVTVRAETFNGLQRRTDYRHIVLEANAWASAWFWPLVADGPTPPTQALFATLQTNAQALPDDTAAEVIRQSERKRFLHFELAFPEVFTSARGGFDVILGNPPYLGGTKISTEFGEKVLQFLKGTAQEAGGTTDLAAYFVRRAFDLARTGGDVGLVTTNSIAEGDTRRAGLDTIVARWGGQIANAVSSTKWEGAANVVVAIVHLHNGPWNGQRTLDGRAVQNISGALLAREDRGDPAPLLVNAGMSFEGFKLDGVGFTVTPEHAARMLARDEHYRDVLFPYVGAEEVMNDPQHAARRWVINFFDWPLDKAEQYGECLDIVRTKVKPVRDGLKRKATRERWWIYGESRPGLRAAMKPLSHVLVVPKHSKTGLPVRMPTGTVFSHALAVITTDSWFDYGVLSSSVHWLWAAAWGSRIKSDLRYTTSDCFETFPRPGTIDPGEIAQVEAAARALDTQRRAAMAIRQVGLSAIYGMVYDADCVDPDIRGIRDCHQSLDDAVVAAYGWMDLALTLGHHAHDRYGVRWLPPRDLQLAIETRLFDLNQLTAAGC